jgi:pimeloyl-ACP methyl ester carboxylesterase
MRRLLPLAVTLLLSAQTPAPGPQVLTFLSPVDDSDQPYALYVPNAYDASKRWPLVISLHGAGSNHRLNLRRVFGAGNRVGESDARATRLFPRLPDVNMIVASPLARGTMGYQTIAERDVYDVLADVKRRFSVDEDRVYLTGLSMGGGGALWLALTRPDVWAAVAAVCPAVADGTAQLAGNALNVPVKLFQGAIDPVVPAEGTRAWQKRFQSLGVKSEYVEFPGVRHNAWDQAYRNAAIFEWFGQYEREKSPARVRFSTTSYRYGSAYWVQLDKLTPGTLASIDAQMTEGNISVSTKALDAFTLDIKTRPAAVRIDGTAVRLRRGAPLSFHRTAKGWTAGRALPGPNEKKPGLEGPISEAISAHHVYVYGDGNQEIAARAADWSTSRSRLLVDLKVVAHKEVPREANDENLILFGTKETNSVIARYAEKLPLHLNPGAADYGLVYVYPVEGRYVVVSSGLPWWTRLDQANRPGLSFIAAPYRTLASFGDYIVFRGGLDQVIAEGRFDNQWRLPADIAAKLEATGAVEVQQK